MMVMPATSQKRLASLLLNAEARQPTASIETISPPRTWAPPPTDNEVMLYWKGGCNRVKAKVAKGGTYLRDTTVLHDNYFQLPGQS